MTNQDFSSAVQAVAAVATLFITGLLAFLTARYVRLTGQLLQTSERQAKLAANPVLGIRVLKIHIGDVFGPDRQDLSVSYELANLSDAPALSVTIDGEILLRYVNVKGEQRIPQRFDPESLEYIRRDEIITPDKARISLSFGNLAVRATLDDLVEEERRNFERLEKDPTRESYRGPRLRLVVRYSNNLAQRFKTEWEADLGVWNTEAGGGWKLPERRTNIELTHMYVPRPIFHSGPETENEMRSDLNRMAANRPLSGW
jgi:hypothetical protein